MIKVKLVADTGPSAPVSVRLMLAPPHWPEKAASELLIGRQALIPLQGAELLVAAE